MYGRDDNTTIGTVVGAVLWTLVEAIAFLGAMASLLALVLDAAAIIGG